MKIHLKFSSCLMFCIVIGIGITYSQQHTKVEVPPVIPPSPDAASLGKYGSHPVSLHTGTPEISIPLYTIQSGSLQLPISISYHAAGFKVNDIASWVGLGWTLNAGGAVSRSIVSLPDEAGFWTENVKSENQITINDYSYLQPMADHTADGQSDFYFYNFPGHSGQFIYRQNQPTNPFLIPDNPITISYSGGFQITDEIGNYYSFTAAENTWVAAPLNDYFPTTYYLSSIVSPDGRDVISFTYVVDGSYTDNSNSYTETIGQQCTQAGPAVDGYHNPNWVGSSRSITPLRLQQINFKNGKVEFIRDLTRSDQPKSRLEEMKVYSKNSDGTFTLRKSFVFDEGYFVTSPGGSDVNNYRLKLTGLHEKDQQGNVVKSHGFFYNEATMLPNHNSLAQDWWGFYNGQNANSSLIATDTITFLGYSYSVGNAIRTPNATAMKACILNKITYPTGGYTEFDFEAHSYLNSAGSPATAGGLRVKEIRDYESAGASPVAKVYKYNSGALLVPEDGLSTSIQEIDFQFWQMSTGGAQSACSNVCNGKKMILSGRPAYDLTMLNGSPVGYGEVEVYEGSLSAPNGKHVFTFEVAEDEFDFAVKAYNNGRLQRNTSWKGGHELKNTVYKGNTTTKVKETQNGYGLYLQQETIGTKVGWKMQTEGCYPYIVTNNEFYSNIYFFDHPFLTGYKRLTSTKEIQYSSVDPLQFVETRTDYHYDNMGVRHRQLSRKIVLDSEGDTLETKYWYAADYNVGTGNIATLKSSNIVAVPIKEENYRNGDILGGKVSKLNDFGKPVEIHTYEINQPQPAPIHDPAIIVPSTYKKRMDISYDASTKNIQRVQLTNDLSTAYIWGYNNALPIAEVKNAEIGAMSTNYNTTDYASLDVSVNTSDDVALASPFEVFSNQNISPTATVAMMGTNGPPSPFLTIILKRSNGTVVKTHNCSWGSNAIGNVALTPGIYQWYYNAIVDAGGGFNGYDLDITTSYTSQRTGYKSFHTSFEENGDINSNALTGSKVWSGVYVLNLPGQNGDYKLSYWQKTGSNPWVLIQQNVTVTAGSVQPMNIGAAGSVIDEIRLFPVGALMTTYTYDPIIGITSSTDVNQKTTYYDYDDFGRLKRVRDSDKNVIKTYSYHFKQ